MSRLYGTFSQITARKFNLSVEDNSSLTSRKTNATENVTVTDSPIMMANSASFTTIWFGINYVIIPCVAVVGIVGNIMSIIVLKRHGLHRSSNILLISLAVADIVYLIGTINIPEMMNNFPQDLDTSPSVKEFLHIWHIIQNSMTLIGLFFSFTIPVLITFDRLVAVFFPLQFASIATVKRTTIAVSVLCSFWIVAAIYFVVVMEISGVVSFSKRDEVVREGLHRFILNIMVHLQGTIPLLFVTTGCIIVGIKTKLVMVRRAGMMSSAQVSQSRTTKMLLAVCFMYVIAGSYKIIRVYVASFVTTDETLLLQDIGNLFNCLNSSWNFIIYVLMNTNLRMTYLSLVYVALPCLRLRLAREATRNLSHSTR